MSANVLTTLTFKDHLIRIKGEDGAPWFVGRDAAKALGYAKPDNALRLHCKSTKVMKRSDFKGTDLVPFNIPNRGLIIIPEPGPPARACVPLTEMQLPAGRPRAGGTPVASGT
jgi:prophage antirepressor-like protein